MSDSNDDPEALIAALRVRAEAAELLHQRSQAIVAGAQQRVRAIFASVRALSAQSAAHATDVPDYVAQFDGRIDALARCQAMMSRNNQVDLEELLREEMLSHAADPAQLSLSGERVLLASPVAEALALAIHELAVDAVKYGTLEISAAWTEARGELQFDWLDRGAQSTPAAAREDFSRDWIERVLPAQIDARTALRFTPTGLECSIHCTITDPAWSP